MTEHHDAHTENGYKGPAFPGLLEEMTVEDVKKFSPEVVVLPLGSTEPHDHLPFGTDSYQVTAVAREGVRKANANGARALLYPTVPITNNVNFRAFRFGLRIGVRTLMNLIIDIVTQCKEDGISKVVLLNGHGGNSATVTAAMREMAGMNDMPFVCLGNGLPEDFDDPFEHPSNHGGESETSRMMYVRPDLVDTGKLPDNPFGQIKYKHIARTTFVMPWHLYVPASAGGDTRKSTAEKGRRMIEGSAHFLANLLVELTEAKMDEFFPFAVREEEPEIS